MNENKSIIAKRIKSLRKECGYTQEQLASILGLNAKSSIANYESGANSPSDEIKKKMSELFSCTIDYLIGLSDVRNLEELSALSISTEEQLQYYMCPVYTIQNIGKPNWQRDYIEGRIPINPVLFNMTSPEEHFFLQINEESMNKIICNGAYAFIHKQDTVKNGEIAALLINHTEATLKKISRQGDLVILEPVSDDSNFQVKIYDKTTSIEILGKYIGKFELKY